MSDKADTWSNGVADERSGGPDDFAAFYAANAGRLVGFLMRTGASRPDAIDAAQEAFVVALQRWGQIAHPISWLFKVAYRLYVNTAQKQRAAPESKSADIALAMAESTESPEATALANEVIRSVSRLPVRQRAVLLLTVEGFSAAEIADYLALSPATVRAHLNRARRQMRKLWQDEHLADQGGEDPPAIEPALPDSRHPGRQFCDLNHTG